MQTERKLNPFREQMWTCMTSTLIGIALISALITGTTCSVWRDNVSYNKGITTIDTTITHYSIDPITCERERYQYACFSGKIVTRENCTFERIIGDSFADVNIWLTAEYPVGTAMTADWHVENKRCEARKAENTPRNIVYVFGTILAISGTFGIVLTYIFLVATGHNECRPFCVDRIRGWKYWYTPIIDAASVSEMNV
ncbi:MAG: hypothetical protein Faunusvirus7_27 [Faunusvirus sp.]|jgi:hypothetical protein|uniref:Uncharacterized protein n=1 Tax=Faunusvirus sp. TaxID=2487766 RepID=A0A3G5A1A1_9VIRU|nr:MAG: hypothetical protein Faunusvirus7_27 [Faunusvirus sp.]